MANPTNRRIKNEKYIAIQQALSLKRLADYPDVLTVEEASELLGVCTKTVYSLIKKGELKKLNVGRLFRIPKREILRYLGIHETK